METSSPKKVWLKQRAKELRREQTPFEHALWQHLRSNRFAGYKFRRQHILGDYIVDFVCLSKRLIVEVDGGQHNSDMDVDRDRALQEQGFRILRFWNNEVANQLEGVLELILLTLHQEPPSPQPLSHEGRGA